MINTTTITLHVDNAIALNCCYGLCFEIEMNSNIVCIYSILHIIYSYMEFEMVWSGMEPYILHIDIKL